MTNSSQDPFTTEKTNPEATPPAEVADPFNDKLKQITNEQGLPKYDSVEKALEALKASQQFIDTLKTEKSQTAQELEQAKAKLAEMGSIEDFVQRISPNTAPPTPEPATTPQVPKGLSEEEVANMVQKQLQQRDAQSQQTTNLNSVISKLTDKYGDKAAEVIKQRAEELNTTAEDLKKLAQTNPNLAMAALIKEEVKPPAPSRSTTRLEVADSADNPKPKWESSTMSGGLTDAQLAERFRQSREYTNKRIGLGS